MRNSVRILSWSKKSNETKEEASLSNPLFTICSKWDVPVMKAKIPPWTLLTLQWPTIQLTSDLITSQLSVANASCRKTSHFYLVTEEGRNEGKREGKKDSACCWGNILIAAHRRQKPQGFMPVSRSPAIAAFDRITHLWWRHSTFNDLRIGNMAKLKEESVSDFL